MGVGGEVGQGCQVGAALFWSRGWSGGRVLLPAGTRSVPRLMATSLYVAGSTQAKTRSSVWGLPEDRITTW